jgi:hypothetical protein
LALQQQLESVNETVSSELFHACAVCVPATKSVAKKWGLVASYRHGQITIENNLV